MSNFKKLATYTFACLAMSSMVFGLALKADDDSEPTVSLVKKCVTKKTATGANDGCEANHACAKTASENGICGADVNQVCKCD